MGRVAERAALGGHGLNFLLAGDPNGGEFTARILLGATELIDCRAVGLHWFDAQLGFPDLFFVEERLRIPGLPVGEALPSSTGLWRVVLAEEQGPLAREMLGGRLSHQLNGPLNTGQGTWGSIHLHRSPEDPPWSEEELGLFRDHCLGLGLVVENRAMHAMLSRENQALRTLARSGRRLDPGFNSADILKPALDLALELTGLTHGLALEERSGGGMQLLVAKAPGPERPAALMEWALSPYEDAGLLRSIRHGSLGAKDLLHHPLLGSFFPQPCRSFVCLPLRDGPDIEGALLLGRAAPMGQATGRLVKSMAPVLADQVARTLHSAHLLRRLAEKSRALEQASEELVEAERLSTAGKLAAAVAHQIRNPLSVISAHVDLLRGRLPEGDSVAEALGQISKKVREANGTIQELLELSRPLRLDLALRDPGEALETLRRFILPKCSSQGVRLELCIEESLPKAWMDETQLQRCLLDLALNAIGEMSQGGVLRMEASLQAGWVRLAVFDQGPGIRADLLPILFEPFRTGRGGGTGMGLYNVRRICNEMGALVVAGSLPEAGACFSLHLQTQARSPESPRRAPL